MIRTRLFVVPLAALVTMLTGCAPDATTAPTGHESVAPDTPSSARAAASGRGAVRMTLYGPLFTIITNDLQQQLSVTLGATEAQTRAECESGTPFDGDPFTYRSIVTPSGKYMEHAQAENVTVLVWDGYYDFDTDICEFFGRTEVLAVGTADYVITGNNYGGAPGAPGATESNLRAHGTVTNVNTGGLMHLVVRAGYLATGGGRDKGFNNNIQLTAFKR